MGTSSNNIARKMQRELGDWHPRQIIRTDELYIQQMLSLDSINPFDAWWFALLKDGILPGYARDKRSVDDNGGEIVRLGEPEDPNPRRALSKLLYEPARKIIPKLKFESDNALGHALRDHGCIPFNRDGRGWEFPILSEARAAWEERMPLAAWDDDLEDWQERTELPPRSHF